jgi:hypothetical protein
MKETDTLTESNLDSALSVIRYLLTVRENAFDNDTA